MNDSYLVMCGRVTSRRVDLKEAEREHDHRCEAVASHQLGTFFCSDGTGLNETTLRTDSSEDKREGSL